jgi:hypothetical protein
LRSISQEAILKRNGNKITTKTLMKQTKINYFFWMLSAVFAAVYLFIVYRLSINIPMDDDFPALQNFLVRFIQAGHIQEKIALLLDDANSHRTVFMRLNVLLVYAVCGKLNYSVYIFLIGLFLTGIGFLLYRMMTNQGLKGLWAFMVVLLLFNGQNLGNHIVAQFGLSNIGSVLITFLSIYLLLLKNRIAFIGGILLSILTIYSNGNGMLLIPPVIVCFGIQKRIKELIWFGVISVTAAAFYFYGLDSSRLGGDKWDYLGVIVMNVFIFVGNNVWVPSVMLISLITGILCSAVYIWGIFNKVYKNNLFCYACLTFLFLTAFAVAAGNEPVLGGEATTPWRYRIYGSLFLILTAFLLVNNAKEFYLKKAVYFFPLFALFFSLTSTVYCYRKGERRLEQKMVSAYRWVNEGKRLGTCYPRAEPELMLYLKEAEQMGLYKMPQYPLSDYKSAIHVCKDKNRQPSEDGILYAVESVEEKEGFLLVEGWAYLRSESALMESRDIYLYLENEENRFVCRPKFERRFDIIDDTRKADCGFFAVIDPSELPSGTYRIGIGIKSRLKLKSPVLYVTTDVDVTAL